MKDVTVPFGDTCTVSLTPDSTGRVVLEAGEYRITFTGLTRDLALSNSAIRYVTRPWNIRERSAIGLLCAVSFFIGVGVAWLR